MNILETILVASFAVAYSSELFSLPFSKVIPSTLMANIATLPMSFFAVWYLGHTETLFIILSFSVAFVSTTLRIIVNVVTSKLQVNQPVTRRTYRGMNEGF